MLVALVLLLVGVIHAADAAPTLPSGVDVAVSSAPTGRTLPSGFLGLSTEYSALEPYAGGNPAAIDPVFVHLVAQPLPRPGSDPAHRR